jgi:type II secretory ATPase GspE/PulE/Tfp pilus assembly ATPase PilB-like protein
MSGAAPSSPPTQSLGGLLVALGKTTADEVERALAEQRRSGLPLGETLVALGAISRGDLDWVLSEQLGLSFVRFTLGEIDPALVRTIPQAYERRHRVLPYLRVGNVLTVLVADPLEADLREDLRTITGCEIDVALADAADIAAAVDASWRHVARGAAAAEEDDARPGGEAPSGAGTLGFADGAPFSEDERARALGDRSGAALADLLPCALATLGADRVVLDITPRGGLAFARVHGTERPLARLERALAEACLERWKIRAGIAPGAATRPEERAFTLPRGPGIRRLRLTVVPGLRGEHAAIEAAESLGECPVGLDGLGLAPEALAALRAALDRSRGVLVVAGARGAGVTTALYAGLGHLSARGLRVATLEGEAARARHPFVQVPIPPGEEAAGERWLEAVLRLAPRAIGIDGLPAEGAIRLGLLAALSGVLAIAGTTVASVATAEAHVLSPALPVPVVRDLLLGVLLLRRIRLLCQECRQSGPVDPRIADAVAFVGAVRPAIARGCAACAGSGYRGRTSIYELARPDADAPPSTLRLVRHGPGVAEQALALYRSGEATADDVLLAL